MAAGAKEKAETSLGLDECPVRIVAVAHFPKAVARVSTRLLSTRSWSFLLALLFLPLLFTACGDAPVPRPYQYFRIGFPEKEYTAFDTTCPFTFQYPVYSEIEPATDEGAGSCDFNLFFPEYSARLHFTYRDVKGSPQRLYKLTEDAFKFVTKHNIKAQGYTPQLITQPARDVYGIVYDIEGDVASNLQFFVTDSTDHYLRGALYFRERPNMDSIAPVVQFIREDVDHLLETLRWREG